MHFVIRPVRDRDLNGIHNLIRNEFKRSVSPHYSREGRKTFMGYIGVEEMSERLQGENSGLVAVNDDDEVLGTIILKGKDHISLFFVREDLQGKGFGRSLMERLIEDIRKDHPDIDRITVNSSPNSVTAYEKLGFNVIEPERILHGISFTRMERIIRP